MVFKIDGNDLWVVSGFAAGDKYGVNDSGTLTEAQADWLNAIDDYESFTTKLATITTSEFEKAYILNLDIRVDGFGGGIAITNMGSEVDGDDELITLDVVLTRTGALSQSINGMLKL